MSGALTIDFAGEIHRAEPGDRITVGRAGTIAIEDNPYLHREFLLFHHVHDNWWVENVGSRLAALVADTPAARSEAHSHLVQSSRSSFPRCL